MVLAERVWGNNNEGASDDRKILQDYREKAAKRQVMQERARMSMKLLTEYIYLILLQHYSWNFIFNEMCSGFLAKFGILLFLRHIFYYVF